MLKAAYMKLSRVYYIQNDAFSSQITNKNRCYIWEKCTGEDFELQQQIEYFHPAPKKEVRKIFGRVNEVILYPFYEELQDRRQTAMFDPNASMI